MKELTKNELKEKMLEARKRRISCKGFLFFLVIADVLLLVMLLTFLIIEKTELIPVLMLILSIPISTILVCFLIKHYDLKEKRLADKILDSKYLTENDKEKKQ